MKLRARIGRTDHRQHPQLVVVGNVQCGSGQRRRQDWPEIRSLCFHQSHVTLSNRVRPTTARHPSAGYIKRLPNTCRNGAYQAHGIQPLAGSKHHAAPKQHGGTAELVLSGMILWEVYSRLGFQRLSGHGAEPLKRDQLRQGNSRKPGSHFLFCIVVLLLDSGVACIGQSNEREQSPEGWSKRELLSGTLIIPAVILPAHATDRCDRELLKPSLDHEQCW